jgi:2-polyprenyl-3-methyl-5-hydroxy-6-metoxy-1,4-benzoquinol methylase
MPSRDYHEALWQGLPAGLEPPDFALRRRFLIENVAAGERVLDIGCGEGRFAGELLREGAEVVGIDVAEEPLRRARTLHPELDLRLVGSDGPWELPDGGFDVVWAGEVLEHVADTAAWLSEARRVLRSGGRLLLSTPAHTRLTLVGLALSRRAFAAHFDPRGDHLRFYSRETLTELLENFRFQELHVRPAGGPPGARRLLLARGVRSRY